MCELAAETAGGWVGVSSWEAAQVRHCLSLSFHHLLPPFTVVMLQGRYVRTGTVLGQIAAKIESSQTALGLGDRTEPVEIRLVCGADLLASMAEGASSPPQACPCHAPLVCVCVFCWCWRGEVGGGWPVPTSMSRDKRARCRQSSL